MWKYKQIKSELSLNTLNVEHPPDGILSEKKKHADVNWDGLQKGQGEALQNMLWWWVPGVKILYAKTMIIKNCNKTKQNKRIIELRKLSEALLYTYWSNINFSVNFTKIKKWFWVCHKNTSSYYYLVIHRKPTPGTPDGKF